MTSSQPEPNLSLKMSLMALRPSSNVVAMVTPLPAANPLALMTTGNGCL